MFIGHLPSGYLLYRYCKKKWGNSTNKTLTSALLGSIFPDFDMLYFYLVDNRAHLHHSYWTHIPIYWFLCHLLISLILIVKRKCLFNLTNIFFIAIYIHLLLDSMVGGILWLYPFSNNYLSLFIVPAVYEPWVLNFIFHWTFTFEIALVSFSILFLIKNETKNIK